jgi:hypothetical protein
VNNTARAEQLRDYLVFRAKSEGMPCDLTLEWFKVHLDNGIRLFCGISVGSRGIEGDSQNASALALWQAAPVKGPTEWN